MKIKKVLATVALLTPVYALSAEFVLTDSATNTYVDHWKTSAQALGMNATVPFFY